VIILGSDTESEAEGSNIILVEEPASPVDESAPCAVEAELAPAAEEAMDCCSPVAEEEAPAIEEPVLAEAAPTSPVTEEESSVELVAAEVAAPAPEPDEAPEPVPAPAEVDALADAIIAVEEAPAADAPEEAPVVEATAPEEAPVVEAPAPVEAPASISAVPSTPEIPSVVISPVPEEGEDEADAFDFFTPEPLGSAARDLERQQEEEAAAAVLADEAVASAEKAPVAPAAALAEAVDAPVAEVDETMEVAGSGASPTGVYDPPADAPEDPALVSVAVEAPVDPEPVSVAENATVGGAQEVEDVIILGSDTESADLD